MRLNQFIAHAGVCARRKADELIRTGQIKINGAVCTTLAYEVGLYDKVIYKGKVLCSQHMHYLLLNKPVRYITSLQDPQGRPTVMDLIASSGQRIYPVGRLDFLTSGLLLLTNDGLLATQLAHPSKRVPKVYQVILDKPLHQYHLQQIKAGIMLSDGLVPVDKIQFTDRVRTKLTLTLHIGRNRIIRRLFAHLHYHVRGLERTHYAGLSLTGNFQPGMYRPLTKREVRRLKELVA